MAISDVIVNNNSGKQATVLNRRTIYSIAGLTGINSLARGSFRQHLLVLCYHGICSDKADVPDPDGLHIPVRLFESQIRYLIRHYQPVSLTQVRNYFLGRDPLPASPVLITFDDGYRNVLRNGLPFLRSLNIPSVLFPVAAATESETWIWSSLLEWKYSDQPGYTSIRKWIGALPVAERREWLRKEAGNPPAETECDYSLADWGELARQLHEGSVEIGSHGMWHEPLTTCTPDEIRTELKDSQNLIRDKLGISVDSIAYPQGYYSTEVMQIGQQCGYKLGFTTEARHASNSSDPMALPRILVGRSDTTETLAARLAGWQEWLRKLNRPQLSRTSDQRISA
jgi:peptidoglycan/xylan/chitin deacetylase (PgdA/CDA1 family)